MIRFFCLRLIGNYTWQIDDYMYNGLSSGVLINWAAAGDT